MALLARLLLSCVLASLLPSLATAELKVGAPAPTFSTKAALGGRDMTFTLADALKKGPVVVYFYPKSFTSVCTEEAHLFAEAMPQFEALGSAVIGMSADSIETQRDFSREGCRDKFPVGADPKGTVVKAYDVLAWQGGTDLYANRTSYVITPDGKIGLVHTAQDAASHIQAALKFVKGWKAGQAR